MVVCAESLSHVQLFATPGTIAYQVPLSMGILQARILESVAMPSNQTFFFKVVHWHDCWIMGRLESRVISICYILLQFYHGQIPTVQSVFLPVMYMR